MNILYTIHVRLEDSREKTSCVPCPNIQRLDTRQPRCDHGWLAGWPLKTSNKHFSALQLKIQCCLQKMRELLRSICYFGGMCCVKQQSTARLSNAARPSSLAKYFAVSKAWIILDSTWRISEDGDILHNTTIFHPAFMAISFQSETAQIA